MKSLINKIILLLLHILIIAALIIGIVHSSKCHIEWINSILSAILGLILSSIFRIIQDLSDNKYWMQTLRQLLRYNKIKKTDYIRISFAYLFRIKIGNKYLLIKNSRGTKKYQPIGGVYKFYDKENVISFLYPNYAQYKLKFWGEFFMSGSPLALNTSFFLLAVIFLLP